jgi:hypothetical protein
MAHKKTFDFTDMPLVSRDEARAQGFKRYFTGIACQNGHIAPRYSRNCKCVMCSAVDALAWQKRMYCDAPDTFRQMCRNKKLKHPLSYILLGSRSRAKRRGIEFTITAADVQMDENCPCCARKMQMRSGPAGKGPLPSSPSLERIDGTKGYIPGNVVILCWRCNEIKRNATLDELRTIVTWLESVQPKTPLRLVS